MQLQLIACRSSAIAIHRNPEMQLQLIPKRQQLIGMILLASLVSDAMDKRWTRSSLACWRLEARTERPVRPLSASALPMDLETLSGRGTWAGVKGGITVGPEVPLMLGKRRGSEGDGEGTVAGSAVDAEISAAEDGTDGGG